MKYCLKCGSENEASSKFCVVCGYNFEEEVSQPVGDVQDGAVVTDVQQPQTSNQGNAVQQTALAEENPEKLQEHLASYTTSSVKVNKDDVAELGKKVGGFFKKMGKKKLIILASTLIVVIAAAIFLSVAVIPYAPHYLDGNKAMESKDYPKAIVAYEKAETFLGADEKLKKAHFLYGEELFGDGEYLDAAKELAVSDNKEKDRKIIECGENLLTEKSFEDAKTAFKLSKDSDAATLADYADAMDKYSNFKYADAKAMFSKMPDVKDSKAMVDNCTFMMGELASVGGRYSDALSFYKQLPAEYQYEGVVAANRISLLENSNIVSLPTGSWSVKKSHIRSSSSSAYWYSNEEVLGTYLKVETSFSTDNTFKIKGSVKFPLLPFFKEVEKTTPPIMETRDFEVAGVTEIPASIKVDDNTTITYSGGEFKLRYSDRNEQGYTRLVNITFGKEA